MTEHLALNDAVFEIRDLLRLIAEPTIAARDAKLRAALRQAVGASAGKRGSALLMDGTRTQREIHDLSGLDQGDLSKLVKRLDKAGLLTGDMRLPRLSIPIPSTFFDTDAEQS